MRNTTGVRGVEAIEEAAILLSRLTVSAKRPAYVEGKHLAISIDPRWSVETETVSLSVTCYTKAVQPVDWQGLRLNIERREGEHSITWLTFLNARGPGPARWIAFRRGILTLTTRPCKSTDRKADSCQSAEANPETWGDKMELRGR